MSDKQSLSFVTCPNSNHINKEGWMSRQIYPIGDGTFKCASCGKVFTREEVKELVEKDYYLMFRDLQQDYQQNIAKLYADKMEKILWLILAAIMFPAIGVGLSAMAGGQHRVSRRPPKYPPGWNNRQQSKRANKARTRQGRA